MKKLILLLLFISNISYGQIPDDVIQEIGSYLSEHELQNLQLVNRQFDLNARVILQKRKRIYLDKIAKLEYLGHFIKFNENSLITLEPITNAFVEELLGVKKADPNKTANLTLTDRNLIVLTLKQLYRNAGIMSFIRSPNVNEIGSTNTPEWVTNITDASGTYFILGLKTGSELYGFNGGFFPTGATRLIVKITNTKI